MVKKINREGIQRMVRNTTTAGNVVNRGGGGVDLAGYATQAWVDEGYLSKEFFNRLFTIHGANNTTITPNDTDSTISSIESMFGFWTNLYITALGNGGDIGSAIYLSQLADVNVAGVQNGQALVYNSATGKWIPGTGGIDLTAMWTALATSDSTKQIDGSHLSTALGAYAYISNGTIYLGSNSITPVVSLTGYATETWVSSQISDMATQTWVNTQISGMATQTWVSQNYISIAYFDRLFRAYNGSTLVNANDTTTTIDNIKAMFGFWTEFYLSALGTGGASGGIALGQLSDVNISNPSAGQGLVYDAVNNQWVNGTVSGGATALSALTDVAIASLQANQVLAYDAVAAKWANRTLSTSLLSDILTSSVSGNQVLIYNDGAGKWVNSSLKTINGYSIIGSGNIDATGSIAGNYLPLSGGTISNSSFAPLVIHRSLGGYAAGIRFSNVTDGVYVSFAAQGSGNNYNDGYGFGTPRWNEYAMLHTGMTIFKTATNNARYATLTNSGWINAYITDNNTFSIAFTMNNASETNIGGVCGAYGENQTIDRYFYGGTYGSAHMAITNSTGYVGIGTMSPAYKLHVAGTLYSSNNATIGGNLSVTGSTNLTGLLTAKNITVSNVSFGTFTIHRNDNAYAAGMKFTNNTDGQIASFSAQGSGNNYSDGYGVGTPRWNDYAMMHSGMTTWKTAESGSRYSSFHNSGWINAYITDNNTFSIAYAMNNASGTNIGGVCGAYGANQTIDRYFYGGTYGSAHMAITNSTGYVGIGTMSPSYKLHVAGSIYATGSVTCASDARMKDVICDLPLTVEHVANAPAVRFTWKGERVKEGLQAGTLAQYWQNALPEVVMDKNNELSMSYGVAALMASIVTARKVVDHERRIKELERENKILKERLKVA